MLHSDLVLEHKDYDVFILHSYTHTKKYVSGGGVQGLDSEVIGMVKEFSFFTLISSQRLRQKILLKWIKLDEQL